MTDSSLPVLNTTLVPKPSLPVKFLQFGEGNFLRAFVDWIIHQMNQKLAFEAGVSVIQPIPQGMVKTLNAQDGLYTLFLNGIENNSAKSTYEVITCIQQSINPFENAELFLQEAKNPNLQFILSNTTEAGIIFDEKDTLPSYLQGTFPAKLTRFMFERYTYFNREESAGCIFLPCELINYNGDTLKSAIQQYASLWNLEPGFLDWIEYANTFCNTLVDRIVPGYPRDKAEELQHQLGYRDQLISEGERFHLWVIEGPKSVQAAFPADKAGLNVVFTQDMQPYRTRKVRILNGAHTSMVPVGYLYGLESVRESVEHEIMGKFIRQTIFEEIIPTLDMPQEELTSFAEDVLDRFRNPFIHHLLISISLNSVSKYKTRCLPSLLTFQEERQQLPRNLVFSLASLLYFYQGNRGEASIPLKDDAEVLQFFRDAWNDVNSGKQTLASLVESTLSKDSFWGQDLTQIAGLSSALMGHLEALQVRGMKACLEELLA